jgi:hypothetical protein
LPADARLRRWLVGDYGGYDETSLPHIPTMVLPATLVTPVGVWLSRSPRHPPAVVMGPSGTYTQVDGPCEPGVMAQLAPLGAYKLLGPVASKIGGSMVGLEDIVGADACRLTEQVQSARN